MSIRKNGYTLLLQPLDFHIQHTPNTVTGGIKGRSQLPSLVDDYVGGYLKVDEYITHRESLATINTAFQHMTPSDKLKCCLSGQ
jgi:Zn-dependent alcohol dehydrogenase